MKSSTRIFSWAFGLIVAGIGMGSNAQSDNAAIPGQYLVELRAGARPEGVASRHGLGVVFAYGDVVNGLAAKVPPGRLRALENDRDVVSVTPDRVVNAIAKPGTGGGGGGPAPQVVPAGVQRIGASPGAVGATGAGVGVAIVDTGLDFNHADLAPLGQASFTAYNGTAQDDNGHGTHVGGIVAARNNSQDVVGVAPNATLYAVKVLNASGSGSDSSVIAGLNWVAQNASAVQPNIRVVNMSLGRTGTLNDAPLMRAAVQNLTALGVAVVVAAGNDSSAEVAQMVPATYPEVMAIASTTALNGSNQNRRFSGFIAADTASYFTTDGAFSFATNIGVTVSAPGEDEEDIDKAGFIQSAGILSTRLGGGTVRLSGTSMAAPHATGVVALMWQQALAFNATLTPAGIQAKIMLSAALGGAAPYASPTSGYSPDNYQEGILSAPGALAP